MEKFTKEQIKFWMASAAWANGNRLGRMKSGELCIYRPPVFGTPTKRDVVITETDFVRDMERGWH